MKKITIIGIFLLVACISIASVSAADDGSWSFSFSSSDNTNSNGGDVSVENNVVNIQGFKFTIPDGFEQNESAQVVGEDSNQTEGLKVSSVEFDKGDQFIVIKVLFEDTEMDEDGYTPAEGAVKKEIADENGWLKEDSDAVVFDYIEDGKLVEIAAPDQAILAELLQSSHDK